MRAARVLASTAAVLSLTGCGGTSDEDAAREAVGEYLAAFVDGDGDRVCELSTGRVRRQVASAGVLLGARSCPETIERSRELMDEGEVGRFRDVDLEGATVAVRGDRATVGESAKDDDPVSLRKVDGQWLIDEEPS